ncbi:MAG: tetratricopeptide repeat protein [candidate division Zixibacteria bacterium]|nr:tetratricopeptide repeat protein [candidate division Zixibacteria bacterium]
MDNYRRFLTGLAVSACLLLPALLQAKTGIRCYVPQAPEIDLGGFKRLAVQNFSGAGSDDIKTGKFLTSRLIYYLTHSGLKIPTSQSRDSFVKTPVKTYIKLDSGCAFQVLDRVRLYQEFSRQWSDLSTLEPELAIEIGEIFDIECIIYGSCKVASKRNKNLNTHSDYGKGGQVVSYQAWCFINEVALTVTFCLVDARTGEKINEKTLNRFAKEEVCDDENRYLIPINQMVEKLADSAARELAEFIYPRFEIEDFELEDLKITGHREEIKAAFGAIENGEPDKALTVFEQLRASFPDHPALLYNLGVLCEITGQIELACRYYARAIAEKDKRKYREALARCEKRVDFSHFYNNDD